MELPVTTVWFLFVEVSVSWTTNDFSSFVVRNSILAQSVAVDTCCCCALVDCSFVKVQNLIKRDFREFVFKNPNLIMVSSLTASCEGLTLLSSTTVRVVY